MILAAFIIWYLPDSSFSVSKLSIAVCNAVADKSAAGLNKLLQVEPSI